MAGKGVIRHMDLSDLTGVCLLEQEAFTMPWSRQAFETELRENILATYLVLDDQGMIAGYAGMWVIIDEAHVTNVAILKGYQGQKQGERLMRCLMNKARNRGAERMTLEVRASNQIAQNLYRKLGFSIQGIRRGYYTDNQEDAFIMWAELELAGATENQPKGE